MEEESPTEKATAVTKGPINVGSAPPKGPRAALSVGNRVVITDLYVSADIEDEREDYAFNIYVRLNAKKKTFRNVTFQHSIFDACYFYNCIFDSCDFVGCRFTGCNLHQSAFSGCKFDYAVFERCDIDAGILEREAPREENLKMRFARSLRMNFQQIGDAKAVNKAILLELQATASYLRKSWSSSETYYREKYPGWKKLAQFYKWLQFKMLDLVWGNGESTWKLLRTIAVVLVLIAIYDTSKFGNPWDLSAYLTSLAAAPGVFFGVANPHEYPVLFSAAVAALRLLGFAFLTAILVKRFGRR